jgi:hypothetical protein
MELDREEPIALQNLSPRVLDTFSSLFSLLGGGKGIKENPSPIIVCFFHLLVRIAERWG